MLRRWINGLTDMYQHWHFRTDILEYILYFTSGLWGTAARHRVSPFRFETRRFGARPVDRLAISEVLRRNEYAFVDILITGESAPQIVDLGANIGLFALYVFHLRSGARVYSVEPSPGTFDVLKANRLCNSDLDWTVLHAAVWSFDGKINFDEGRYSTSSRVSAVESGLTVPAVSLASLFKAMDDRRIHVMKIDIEGAEGEVLKSAAEVLKLVDHLVVEVHPNVCTLQSICDVLRTSYRFLYNVTREESRKPLIVTSQNELNSPLFSLLHN